MSIPSPATSLFATLKSRSGPLWDSAQNHPFVHALADGSLPRESFIHYLKQDYIYCIAFCRAAALAAARARNVAEMQLFSGMVHAVLNTELEVHREYCGQFGITPAQLEATEAAPGCRAYLDFCVATAALEEPVALLATLVPCAVGYAEIGARLKSKVAHAAVLADKSQAGPPAPQEHPYRRWIDNYAGAEYQGFAQWIIRQLDEFGGELSPRRVEELSRLFNLGCRYEWIFWEMAWTNQQWPI